MLEELTKEFGKTGALAVVLLTVLLVGSLVIGMEMFFNQHEIDTSKYETITALISKAPAEVKQDMMRLVNEMIENDGKITVSEHKKLKNVYDRLMLKNAVNTETEE